MGARPIPNGRGFLLFADRGNEGNNGLFFVGPDGGKARPVQADGYVADAGLVVSPDGDRIAYAAKGGQIRTAALFGNDVSTVPGPPLRPSDGLAQWSADGRYLFVVEWGGGGIAAQVDRLELATGRREPWKKLMPSDPTGVDVIIGPIVDLSRRSVLRLRVLPAC